MRIGEIAEKTGLSISNIRFYEKKGLIGPDREAESKYRNYTEEDLNRLQLIILYRKMDLSVEDIGRVLTGSADASDLLEQKLLDLKEKQQQLQSSMDLCRKVLEDGAAEPSMPPEQLDYYLNYVKEEEASGRGFEKIDDLLEDFSAFTQFDRITGSSLLGWQLFSHPRYGRLVRGIWFLLFLMIPVIGLAEDLILKNDISTMKILFWVVWFLFLIWSFLAYRRKK